MDAFRFEGRLRDMRTFSIFRELTEFRPLTGVSFVRLSSPYPLLCYLLSTQWLDQRFFLRVGLFGGAFINASRVYAALEFFLRVVFSRGRMKRNQAVYVRATTNDPAIHRLFSFPRYF
ncbi:uncharacterized protein LOC113281939 [Papaver somniferum]|uniref:uncharacterized protein LOC113281939 n=1 Tax=Papaver somniferum TaxID=3469 RepID=UPI000E6F5898|nr:uncharacterized protein LOC113281939 [Papaver somniferum]